MVLEKDKTLIFSLIFLFLFIGVITIYISINHQQNIDNQILSGTIHILNTTNEGVEDSFKRKL